MTPVYGAQQVRLIDAAASTSLKIPSLVLMENAARGACDVLFELGLELRGADVAIVCGRGNNGGDGIALARHCLIHGASVRCILLDARERLSSDASAQLAMLEAIDARAIEWWSEIAHDARAFDIVVDAILGTGAGGAPRDAYAEAVRWMNDCDGVKVALDVPTGLDTDSGIASDPCCAADVTVTTAAMKPGLVINDGVDVCGAIYVAHIGVPPSSYPEADCWMLDAGMARSLLPRIEAGRNKYDRGTVLVVAGARGMTGAAIMSATAAARTGAGLTVLAVPESAWPAPQEVIPEVMTRALASGADGAFAAGAFSALSGELDRYAAIAIGPGLSKSADAAALVVELLGAATSPVVLDADGLAGFAGAIERLAERASPLVITPHHGEMARLLGRTSAEVGRDPIGTAREAARRSGAIVALKGAPTVVALPDGRAWINDAGNPGMATGGTGDVLTGMIASLAAQCRSADDAALAAVYLHSLAADVAAEQTSEHALLATDIIAHIAQAYRIVLAEDE
jgi:NAD(P)H-hydrate epimerase